MIKKVTFGVLSYFFRKRNDFPSQICKSPKNIEKSVIYAVLEKKNMPS